MDLAAMEERLKRFDAEREATNTWLKSNFPDLADLLKAPPPGAGPTHGAKGPKGAEGVHGATPADGAEVPAPVAPHTEDVYERVPVGYHMRPDVMQRGLANEECGADNGIPAVGRPQSSPREGGGGRKLRSFAEALEQESQRDREIINLMAAGFAENDLIDHLRDSSAKASERAFERGYQDREHMYQYERDNQRRALERDIQTESLRKKDDLERTRRDDELRRSRDDADRTRRDAAEADTRRRELDAQNARRDAERRDQELRDQVRRAEEERIKADRERG